MAPANPDGAHEHVVLWEALPPPEKGNNIVDPKNDLQQRQRTERKPALGSVIHANNI